MVKTNKTEKKSWTKKMINNTKTERFNTRENLLGYFIQDKLEMKKLIDYY